MSSEQESNNQEAKADQNTQEKKILIAFSVDELHVLTNLMDIAVRARGLDVAGNAVVLHQKIKQAVLSS